MASALHIQNGIVNAPVSLAYLGIAVVGFVLATRHARHHLDERLAPMAGLVAAYVFAVQMLNFPVLPGVSGHLLGGALAALLVGPWVGALAVSIVLVVQALLFADGGVTAIGLNIANMALLGTASAYGLIVLLLRLLPATRAGLAVTAFTAGLVSTLAAAFGFVLQYALGGVTPISLEWLVGAMGGTHLLIGVGEGVITAVTVVTVARVRPDLVYALRHRPRRPVRPAPRPAEVPV
jgi:cobalt/nickel transport system permease protein